MESMSCVDENRQMGEASSAAQLQEASGLRANCWVEAKDFGLFDKINTTPAYSNRGAALKRHR